MKRAWPISLLLVLSMTVAACGSGNDDGSGSDLGSGSPGEARADADLTELRVSISEWPNTDFSKANVPLGEFLSGGPPRDGIASVDDPKFVAPKDEDLGLADSEPVAVVVHKGEARAYPIRILTRHEIVNDEIGGDAIAVTYCPLCNSTVAFLREIEGEAIEFGTTGNLRNSDLVMYDRKTESWWQQLTAEAIVGELTGTRLDVLPSQILSWKEFGRQHPEGRVLSGDTGFGVDYGQNPYPLYDVDPDDPPFLLDKAVSNALPPKERVASVKQGDRGAIVYPFPLLAKQKVVNDRIGEDPVVVLFDPTVASPLDAPTVAGGRDVGAAGVFKRRLGGRTLTFEPAPSVDDSPRYRDRETGSVWDFGGTALSGPLAGRQLIQIPSDDQFWFAVAAFFEDPDIRG